MAISTTGTFQQPTGTGALTATVTVANAGDFIAIFLAIANGSSISPATLTGNNGVGALSLTTPTYDAQVGAGVALFYGKCPNAGSTVFTPTFSASPGTNGVQYDAWLFTAGLGATTIWGIDGSGTQLVTASTTISYPSLVAGGVGELYAGCACFQAQGLAGATSGFTYDVDAGFTNVYLRNTNASGTLAPTASQTGGGTASIASAVLVTANAPLSRAPVPISQYSSYH